MFFARFFIVLFVFLLAACSEGGSGSSSSESIKIEAAGLDGMIVERLYLHDESLFAITHSGLYRKRLSHDEWQPLGLAEYRVHDFVFVSDQHFLASISYYDENGFPAHGVYESIDSGQSWREVVSDFGASESELIYAFAYDPQHQMLYAAGAGLVARSTDYGRSWQVLHGEWQSYGGMRDALSVNFELNEIWSGGQGTMEDLRLEQFNLQQGEMYSHSETVHPLLSTGIRSPATIESIRFGVSNPQHIYVSGEGGIAFSPDNGSNWIALINGVDHRFYYDIIQDTRNESRLFTARFEKNFYLPQPLIFEWSHDHGENWESFVYPDSNLLGGVRAMQLVEENRQRVIYLGLYGGGVMRVTPEF